MKVKRVHIHPFDYTVQHVKGLVDNGTCHPDHEQIHLSEAQAEGQKRDTLLHESIHAIIAQGMAVTLKELDPKLEESLVGFLAPRLLALLRDNPELVDYLTEDA